MWKNETKIIANRTNFDAFAEPTQPTTEHLDFLNQTCKPRPALSRRRLINWRAPFFPQITCSTRAAAAARTAPPPNSAPAPTTALAPMSLSSLTRLWQVCKSGSHRTLDITRNCKDFLTHAWKPCLWTLIEERFLNHFCCCLRAGS